MTYSTHRCGSRPRARAVRALAATALAGTGLVWASAAAAPSSAAAAPSSPALHVAGDHLVNASGSVVQLAGVNRSGTEYACVQGWGIFDGPSDEASVQAMASWHANAVRIPLNEDCWLGINGVPSAYSGANYRSAIVDYVNEVDAAGMVAILDLHWGAPGSQLATSQEQMPDEDHAPAFWSSVAGTFASTPGVMFDLFNEPHDVSWSCWRDGCVLPDGTQAAGMQQLLDAVRAAGAAQPVMVEGLNWGGDLSGWLANQPSDPDHALVASAHIYNFSQCNTTACWDSTLAPVAASVPLVTGELGETDCADGFIDSYMPWADAHGISYLAWTWDAGGSWSCSNGPALLDSYDGTPDSFGAGYKTHLAALASSSPAPSPGTSPAAPSPGASPAPTASASAGCSTALPRGSIVGMATTPDGQGYWIASSTGAVAACGDAPDLGGGPGGTAAIASANNGDGYWLVTRSGQVSAFGTAVDHGGVPAGARLTKPIVAMAADPATGGYWLLGGDGGVFSFGAPFFGSTGNIRLDRPAVGLAATPDGAGYYFVASDGGVFAFGRAPFYGSTGNIRLDRPVVGMAVDPVTGGYWLDAADGGIFAFHAPFDGSTGNVRLAQPCVGMTGMPGGGGYRFVAADGGIFSFHAPFEGSAAP